VEEVAQVLHYALGIIEVVRARGTVPCRWSGVAAQEHRQPRPLSRTVPYPTVALPYLEYGHVRSSLPLVEGQNVQQASDQVLAQYRVLTRERIGDDDCSVPGRIRDCQPVVARPLQPGFGLGRDEGMSDHLGQPGPRQRLPNGVADRDGRRSIARHRCIGQVRGRGLVATNAGHFLGHVRLDLEIAAPRRHNCH
jgi:hypothetical protein